MRKFHPIGGNALPRSVRARLAPPAGTLRHSRERLRRLFVAAGRVNEWSGAGGSGRRSGRGNASDLSGASCEGDGKEPNRGSAALNASETLSSARRAPTEPQPADVLVARRFFQRVRDPATGHIQPSEASGGGWTLSGPPSCELADPPVLCRTFFGGVG